MDKRLSNVTYWTASLVLAVGAAGFEPATSRTRTERATGLRYAPMG